MFLLPQLRRQAELARRFGGVFRNGSAHPSVFNVRQLGPSALSRNKKEIILWNDLALKERQLLAQGMWVDHVNAGGVLQRRRWAAAAQYREVAPRWSGYSSQNG
jgi:hypothetical protein